MFRQAWIFFYQTKGEAEVEVRLDNVSNQRIVMMLPAWSLMQSQTYCELLI